MINLISILSPTKKRPGHIRNLINSIHETADNVEDLELVLYIDEDDNSYDDLLKEDLGIEIKYIKGPKIVISDMWNKCCNIATGPIYHHASDDFLYRSKSWDTKVKQHFDACDDKIILVYGMDGHQNQNLGTLSFIHKNWVNVVGYLVPGFFDVDWCDTWINDVAHGIGRRIYDDSIYTEHLHPAAGKSEIDETYATRQEMRQKDSGWELYNSTNSGRIEDMNKLNKFINEFKENK